MKQEELEKIEALVEAGDKVVEGEVDRVSHNFEDFRVNFDKCFSRSFNDLDADLFINAANTRPEIKKLLTAYEAQAKEIERLREALEQLLSSPSFGCGWCEDKEGWDEIEKAETLAKQALKGGDDAE